jgi:hypothetical protein
MAYPRKLRHRRPNIKATNQRFRKVVWIYGWSRHPIFSPGGSAASDVPASLGSGQSFA